MNGRETVPLHGRGLGIPSATFRELSGFWRAKNADSALESGFFPPESRWDMPIEGVLRLTF